MENDGRKKHEQITTSRAKLMVYRVDKTPKKTRRNFSKRETGNIIYIDV